VESKSFGAAGTPNCRSLPLDRILPQSGTSFPIVANMAKYNIKYNENITRTNEL
jgi:hypothetical protein